MCRWQFNVEIIAKVHFPSFVSHIYAHKKWPKQEHEKIIFKVKTRSSEPKNLKTCLYVRQQPFRQSNLKEKVSDSRAFRVKKIHMHLNVRIMVWHTICNPTVHNPFSVDCRNQKTDISNRNIYTPNFLHWVFFFNTKKRIKLALFTPKIGVEGEKYFFAL